jgi:hypothetical protein
MVRNATLAIGLTVLPAMLCNSSIAAITCFSSRLIGSFLLRASNLAPMMPGRQHEGSPTFIRTFAGRAFGTAPGRITSGHTVLSTGVNGPVVQNGSIPSPARPHAEGGLSHGLRLTIAEADHEPTAVARRHVPHRRVLLIRAVAIVGGAEPGVVPGIRMFERETVRFPFSFALESAGRSGAARMAMMALGRTTDYGPLSHECEHPVGSIHPVHRVHPVLFPHPVLP